MGFVGEALTILFLGFILLRIAGKKTVSEMTGLEIITLLSIASVIGHAVSENGLGKTMLTLCTFVALLLVIQYLAMKFNLVEKLFMGKATLVVQNGQVIRPNLNRLRMSTDQLASMLREKGIASFADVKSATIEISGHLGYELMEHARPVTLQELESILAGLRLGPTPPVPEPTPNLFDEIVRKDQRLELQ